jgi:hypothetical protein
VVLLQQAGNALETTSLIRLFVTPLLCFVLFLLKAEELDYLKARPKSRLP